MTPGIPEAMRYASMAVTPRAMLSRAPGGIRGGTLIVNLPGSPKAARENLEAVLPALAHGLEMLSALPPTAPPSLPAELPPAGKPVFPAKKAAPHMGRCFFITEKRRSVDHPTGLSAVTGFTGRLLRLGDQVPPAACFHRRSRRTGRNWDRWDR